MQVKSGCSDEPQRARRVGELTFGVSWFRPGHCSRALVGLRRIAASKSARNAPPILGFQPLHGMRDRDIHMRQRLATQGARSAWPFRARLWRHARARMAYGTGEPGLKRGFIQVGDRASCTPVGPRAATIVERASALHRDRRPDRSPGQPRYSSLDTRRSCCMSVDMAAAHSPMPSTRSP